MAKTSRAASVERRPASKALGKRRPTFYDVFGLDDDDLREFGAASDSFGSSTASVGITAWWQLQHQHGYAPLVTLVLRQPFDSKARSEGSRVAWYTKSDLVRQSCFGALETLGRRSARPVLRTLV
jgi:hypothetical protein